MIQYTHWSKLWFHHTYLNVFIQAYSKSDSKQINSLLALIMLSDKASSTSTPTAITTDADVSGPKSSYMLTVIIYFVDPSTKFNGGRLPT